MAGKKIDRQRGRNHPNSVKRREENKLLAQNRPSIVEYDEEEIIRRLESDGRLEMFISYVEIASSKQLNMRETVDFLKKTMPTYLSNKYFNIDTFIELMRNNLKISMAYGMGDMTTEVYQRGVNRLAYDLTISSDKLTDIELYNKMYNKDNMAEIELHKAELENKQLKEKIKELERKQKAIEKEESVGVGVTSGNNMPSVNFSIDIRDD